MSRTFNMVGGGGSDGAQKKATIVVTYPSGATCTVSNGGKTYTALDTSGVAAFVVEPGVWTVKAVQGSESDSKLVTVTAGGWVSVELSFFYYLFKSGDGAQNKMTYKHASASSTTISFKEEYIEVTRHATNSGETQLYSEEKHDLSAYSNLYFDVSIQGVFVYENNYTRCGVFSTAPSPSLTGTNIAVTRIESNDNRITYTVDLSGIGASTWPLYVGLGGSFYGKIYNIWAG